MNQTAPAHGPRRSGVLACSAIVLAVCGFTIPAAADVTLHFDLPRAPLGFFGQQFTADFITPVREIEGGVITETRFHLEFDTTVAPNPFGDAAHLAIDFQPPAGTLPIFTLTGADLGWSGTGTFTADFATDALNLPILDFPPDAEFALWFMRIFSSDDANPLLGGQLSNSYIEVDVAPIPAPGGLAMLAAAGAAAFSRRRRGCGVR